MRAPFQPSPQYTAIALAYTNKELIADQVLPRAPVAKREFKWDLHEKSERFTVPTLRVGRKGTPSEVEFTATEQTSSVDDYGLDDVVPYEDIEQAAGKPGLDPLGRATTGVTELIALGREKRVADLVFSAATYPTGSKVTLSGNDQWSAYSQAASDPLEDILAAREGMLMPPNTLVLGSQVAYVLRRHPKIIAAVNPSGGNAATGGVVSLQALADLFEVQRLLVGSAWINTAKPGQTASLSRIWGKHAALLRINPLAGVRGNDISFGMTAEYGNRVAGTIPEPKVGLRGAERVRVGETVKELITAADCGYFFESTVV
jgi:hypothetical protein